MKMKQEMRPTLKQKQVLTMKQQQDLKILSFSSSELQTYIEEQVESKKAAARHFAAGERIG